MESWGLKDRPVRRVRPDLLARRAYRAPKDRKVPLDLRGQLEMLALRDLKDRRDPQEPSGQQAHKVLLAIWDQLGLQAHKVRPGLPVQMGPISRFLRAERSVPIPALRWEFCPGRSRSHIWDLEMAARLHRGSLTFRCRPER